MNTQQLLRHCRQVVLYVLLLFCAPLLSHAQPVNEILIQMLSYDYNCQTGMATVKYHITNSDASGHVGGYETYYSINLGVYSTSGSIANGDDDVEFTGGYIPGDMIVCTAQGGGNNFSYPMEFRYQGYIPKPAPPDIWMLSPVSLCNGQSVTIEASGSNGNYLWSNGMTGPSITVTTAGTYSVQAIGSCGNSDPSNAITVVVGNAPAAPSISSSNGELLCNGAGTVLSASGSGSISWSNGASGDNIAVNTAGTYYATASNGCGTSSNSNMITIAVGSLPSAPAITPAGPLNVCNGSSVGLSASPSAGGTIYWSNGATGNSITVSNAGSYYAYESNACGSSSSSNSVVVTTGGSPSAPTISSSGTIACNGGSITLSASPSSGGTIYWSNGASGDNIAVNAAGTYYAYENNTCGNSSNSNTISISTGNTPPAATINATGSYTLCDGASKVLTTSPATGGTMNWNTGATGNSITVATAGAYYVYESNACGNGPMSEVVNISTLNTPSAPAITPPGSQLLCNGQTISFNASGSNITWSNGATGNNMITGVAGTYYAYDRNYCGNSPNSNTVVITTGNCPTPSPGTSFFICPGALKILDAGAGYDTYAWSNGATTRTIAVGPGNYAVTVSKDGCYATSVTVSVSYYTVTTPVINVSGATSFCEGSSVTLASSVASAYLWSNGSTGNSINVTTSGNYYVTVTDGNGCQASSAATAVTVHPLPVASIAGTTSVCKNASAPVVTFNASGGTAPYTFYYTINGGSTQTITASGNSMTLSVPVSVAGTFIYNLIGVQESSSTTCYNAASGSAMITVNELPTANIAGNNTVCLNGASPLISFTGSNGTAPYTFTYAVNGGAAQTVTTTSGNSVSVSVPANVAGTFTYSLISVQEASGLACSNAASGEATVTVRPLPAASITGSTTVCQNSTEPAVVFTGSVGNAPYTFIYNIDGGATQSITTTSGNSVAVPVPTNTEGTFTYNLISVQESGAGSCSNTASGSATVVVNPLPSASISGSVTVCQNSAQSAITFTGSNAIAPYTFVYKINGGAAQSVTTVSGNSVSVNASTDVAGSFVYELVSVQEASSTACVNAVNGTASVIVRPLPTATITGSTTVCKNSVKPLITFTGSVGNAPYTFTYKINGGTDQTVTTTSGNTVTVEVPTDIAGSFVYTLIGVQESGSPACMNMVSGAATVIVNPLPTATIASNTTVCQNGTAPLITFTGADATAPYTFTYSINGGAVQTVTTISGNSVAVPVPTNVAGVFTYSLIGVQEASGVSCSNAASGSAVVVINPQPAAAVLLAPNTHLCNGEAGQLTIYNWTEGFTYAWFKDGVLLTTSTAQTLSVTQVGTYTVMVVSNLGCNAPVLSNAVIITTGSISTPIITGSLKVCEGGKTNLLVLPTDKNKLYELYRWTDTPIGDTLSTEKSFSAYAGQYRVNVAREGCYDSLNVVVIDNDTEYPAGNLKVAPNVIAYGGEATLTAEVTGAVAYHWDFGNDVKTVSASNKMLQRYFIRTDSVLVKVMAVSERNCKSEFTALLKVGQPDTLVFADHPFTGNLKDWNLFPVPFRGELKLSVILQRNETFKLDLFTGDGSWVRSWEFKGRKGENLFTVKGVESLPAGVLYYVTGFYNNEKHFDKIYKY